MVRIIDGVEDAKEIFGLFRPEEQFAKQSSWHARRTYARKRESSECVLMLCMCG